MQDVEKLIVDKMEWHRSELARLDAALAVVREIGGRADRPAPKMSARKARAAAKTPSRAARTATAPSSMRERVLEVLSGSDGGMKSAGVIEKLGMGGAKQQVYSALNQLKSQGKVEKGEEGAFRLVQ